MNMVHLVQHMLDQLHMIANFMKVIIALEMIFTQMNGPAQEALDTAMMEQQTLLPKTVEIMVVKEHVLDVHIMKKDVVEQHVMIIPMIQILKKVIVQDVHLIGM